jgi:hypothetical protein
MTASLSPLTDFRLEMAVVRIPLFRGGCSVFPEQSETEPGRPACFRSPQNLFAVPGRTIPRATKMPKVWRVILLVWAVRFPFAGHLFRGGFPKFHDGLADNRYRSGGLSPSVPC